MENQKLLSVGAVAGWLDVSPAWIRDHAQGRRKPRLVGVKLGSKDGKGLWKFLKGDVEAFIHECRQA